MGYVANFGEQICPGYMGSGGHCHSRVRKLNYAAGQWRFSVNTRVTTDDGRPIMTPVIQEFASVQYSVHSRENGLLYTIGTEKMWLL